ncbi:MAG: hypothetical protein HYV14_12750 [Elusimicrobia bacterium]|nr:hypothetical protein [Elusimicrobiota bacterium]
MRIANPEERRKQDRAQVKPPRSGSAALIVAATAVWTIVVVHQIVSGQDFGRYFGRWLGYDFAFIPAAHAAAGHVKRLLAAATITLSLLGVGRLLLRTSRFVAHNPWEEAALSFGLGYGSVGTLLLLLGLCGLWSGGFLTASLAALAVLSFPGLRELFLSVRRALTQTRTKPDALGSCAGALVVLVWLYSLRYALIPETFYDALVYHLALPAQYLLHGGVYPTPSNSYSGVPALPQMLSGLALAIEPWGIAASILHCSLLLWCCVALVGLSRRLGRPQAGVLAALIFAATPVVIGESFRVSVGLEWALMELCCLTGLLVAAEEQNGLSMPAIVLAGSFLGFAMTTKYPAWLLALAAIPLLSGGRLSTAEERKRFTARLLACGAIAMVLIVPWVLKNVFFYGNPLYPFFHERFAPAGAAVPDWRQISAAGTDLGRFLTPAGFWSYLRHPWDFLKPADDLTQTTGPVYLALLPALLLFPFERGGRLVAVFAAAAWVPLSVLSPMTRFFIPHLAVLALLVAYLIEGLQSSWAARSFRIGAVGLAVLSALGWAVMDSNRGKLPVYLGAKEFGDYLGHTTISYPPPPYAGYEFLNKQAPANAKVLIYSESRGFYLNREAILSSPDQRTALESWADESADGAALARKIRQEGVSFILVNGAEMTRLKQAPRVTPAGLRVLDDFWKRYTARVFGVLDPKDRWVGVYSILDDAQAARPHLVDDLFGQYLKKSGS